MTILAENKTLTSERLMRFLLLLVLIFYTELFLSVFVSGDRAGGPQISLMRPVFAVGRLATTVFIISVYGFRWPRSLFLPITAWIFLAFATASTLWSETGAMTLYKSIEVILLFLAMSVCATTLSRRLFIQGVTDYLWLAVVAGGLLALLWPTIGVHGARDVTDPALIGNWRGAYLHKNLFAPVALMFFGAVISGVVLGQRNFALRAVAALLTLGLLVKIGSATSIALIPAYIGLEILMRAGKTTILIAFALIFALLFQIVFLNYSAELFELLGRDSTFSSRTLIWQFWMKLGWEAPWLGHGYYSAQQAEVHAPIARALFASAVHAHSGFIDLFFNIGIVGLSCFVAMYALRLLAALRDNSAAKGHDALARFTASTLIIIPIIASVDVTVLGFVSQLGPLALAMMLATRPARQPAVEQMNAPVPASSGGFA